MPTVPVYTKPSAVNPSPSSSFPPVLQTPQGLALIELQGTLNFPADLSSTTQHDDQSVASQVGKLVFPACANDPNDSSWYKQVYLYIGANQRMGGEVKRLPKPLAIVKRRGDGAHKDELEVTQVVRWKILFSGRPEPVGEATVKEVDGSESQTEDSMIED